MSPPALRLRRIEPLLRRALRGPCRVTPGSTVLVAISGGADSTALLLGLSRIAPELGLRLAAAHLDHGLRGKDAADDRAFVTDLCARLGVPLHAARWDTRARMRHRGWSGHEGLRRLRREFLEAKARAAGAAAIATAHHAQDQLETLLMRLLRGAGLRGLGGMSARHGLWIRPLLGAGRDQIEADLRGAREVWREDASNGDRRHLRSRIRHDVLPVLINALQAGKGPGVGPLSRRVARGLQEVRAARRVVEARAARRLRRLKTSPPGRHPTYDAYRLAVLPPGLRRAALRALWAGSGSSEGLGLAHLAAIEGLLRRGDEGRIDLPTGRRATVLDGRLQIGSRSDSIEAVHDSAQAMAIPGRLDWEGLKVETRWVSGSSARRRIPGKSSSDEAFAAERLKGRLQLRAGKSDEWFVPFGQRRRRRLKEFLARQQVPRGLRRRPLVLADEAGILWVIGVRRSARAALTPATRRAIWVHCQS